MALILIETFRNVYYPATTIGELFVKNITHNGLNKPKEERFCYTLEDTVRAENIKVQNYTAIPAGVFYKVGIHHSAHLKRDVLILYNQPDGITLKAGGIEFTYVYFHALNNSLQTDGCVGVGFKRVGNTIEDARKAEIALFNKIAPHIKAGEDVRAVFHNVKFSG